MKWNINQPIKANQTWLFSFFTGDRNYYPPQLKGELIYSVASAQIFQIWLHSLDSIPKRILTRRRKKKHFNITLYIAVSAQTYHTGSNFILIVIARAISNFSKNHTVLICRIQKWMNFFGSSLAIRDNFKVAFFGKNLTNVISKEICATFISGNQYDRLSQQQSFLVAVDT